MGVMGSETVREILEAVARLSEASRAAPSLETMLDAKKKR